MPHYICIGKNNKKHDVFSINPQVMTDRSGSETSGSNSKTKLTFMNI